MVKKSIFTKSVMAVAIILSGVMFAACGGAGSDSPKGVVEQSYDAVKAKDYAKAVSFYHDGKSGEEQLAKDREKLAEMMQKMAEGFMGDFLSYTIGEETIAEDGQSAVVSVEMEWSKTGKQTQKIKTQKIDGKWWIVQ